MSRTGRQRQENATVLRLLTLTCPVCYREFDKPAETRPTEPVLCYYCACKLNVIPARVRGG